MAGRLELTWWNKDRALIPAETGKYSYTWVDRADPRACQTHYLIDEEHVGDRSDGGVHDNLLVRGESGDVLEALTRVPELAERYVRKVKCVYIDPPFNTEKSFSHYEDNLEHSVWLTMMRDRLTMLRTLLSDDGSIWVHLNYDENHRMRCLLDEVFGADKFAAEVVWQKSDSPRRGTGFSTDQDVILVYGKTAAFAPKRSERTDEDNERFTNPDNDPDGPWWDDNPTANHGDGKGGMCYAIQNPITGELVRPGTSASWRYSQDRILASLNEWAPYRKENLHDAEYRAKHEGVPPEKTSDDVYALVLDVPLEEARIKVEERRAAGSWPEIIIRQGGTLGRKAYIPLQGSNPRTWWTNEEVGHNREAKAEVKALFPGEPAFPTPKPERLLARIIRVATEPGEIVLDCFGGSGTTASVAHKLGRRWVTCELLDSTVEKHIRPRLEKVIAGTDMGGATILETHTKEVPLPGNTTLKEARSFNLVLGRLLRIAAEEGISFDQSSVEAMRELTRTRTIRTQVWHGGGGFDVARLSPEWVEVETDEYGRLDMFTTPQASGDVLARSIAAHLRYRLTPDDPWFVGVKGRSRLAVVEGILTMPKLEELLFNIPEGDTGTLACYDTDPGVDRELRRRSPGSRILLVPHDLFKFNPQEA
ncbi:site-specific DNA-methyltransferase [Paenarthrobacter aurescens]|uniref:DNA methylase N-4/N-6 domain-containing protein n=1 Tax=Paenarthrobacter aurescens TaxID=43663 RepID=A0A4Y3NEG8_PAEAU|nr:site-specific DNA-methyltransferase [Paenarthrobacter aurescens]MDO6144909.1 site-specific DNA-methyltransferase [Paenarthrobacter aurescens]MDO6148754.1 site-specific DNA-methyltransferase [Paenarthrobacter aurescens]MDO6160000.1 site-specific DNA-methyltransferase [Paenarthrobacter aurescens]MDO6163859.1 site-specific DNA-methyltransferase [Paenarthrobacter aurescens]GEB17431.1 hypothetical protein AAU01_01860 [Paenarthrobacter aurescens]